MLQRFKVRATGDDAFPPERVHSTDDMRVGAFVAPFPRLLTNTFVRSSDDAGNTYITEAPAFRQPPVA